ncbi:MAG TPA: HD domain-containing phosphohydrolase [Candidatus Hydrogenedentes bacterium]|nr:HD domain-containing phosphohydrolase [Candidatus Hydrogenedentota bacterium]
MSALNIVTAETGPGGETYRPVAIASIRLNTAPTFDLHFRPGPAQPLVLYSQRGLPITHETLRRLGENRIETLYIHEDALSEYRQYVAENLYDILADAKLPIRDKANILYNTAQAVLEEVFEHPPTRETVAQGKEISRHTVDLMTADGFTLEDLLRTISTDYYLYTHSVNVATYAVALALRAGYADTPTLREIANGALFHDVGMSRIDPAIRAARAPLTPDQWARLKQHPVEGHALLESLGCLGEVALDIVLHHHERLDGKGYPHGLGDKALSPFVRMVSVCNVFDALTTDRHHQPARKTFAALHIMQTEMRHELDQGCVRMFIEMMGLRS